MYPSLAEYIESIENAVDNLEVLSHLTPVRRNDGSLIYSSGNFAVVFKMEDEDGNFYALKCFTQEASGREDRYQKICDTLCFEQSSYFVSIKFYKDELFVDCNNSEQETFPVLVMEWVDGIPLDSYVRNHIDDKYALKELSYRFSNFASWLVTQPFAHGDLKPDNLLVKKDGSIVAVDYDGMYVPSMSGMESNELGSPDYRHPNRNSKNFDSNIDDFTLAVIALSLEAIATNPELLKKYAQSDGLLFSERDYLNLSECKIFGDLVPLFQYNASLQSLMSLFLLAHQYGRLECTMYRFFRLPLPLAEGTKIVAKNISKPFIDLGLSYDEMPPSNHDLIFNVNGVEFKMIKVEAGSFMMGLENGDDDEKPVHKVNLTKDYYIGETQVTQALWQAVMGSNPSDNKGDNKPVEEVSWDDCQEFIQKLNEKTGKKFRLPTEAEWEFAARGGNKSKGYTYAGSNDLGQVGWYDGNCSKTQNVRKKQPNELGIYDMSGNVWEWCKDWYGDYPSKEVTDPKGYSSGSYRVLRGGSYYNGAGYCRVSYRNFNCAGYCSSSYGLRLAY